MSKVQSTDPLASVLELQKSTFRGFIRDVTCNSLLTVTLFTNQQVDNLTEFCCHSRSGWVFGFAVDNDISAWPILFSSYNL